MSAEAMTTQAGRYAAGLPLVGRRPLSDRERAWVRRKRRRLELASSIWFVGIVAMAMTGAWCTPVLEPEIVARLGGPTGVALATTGAVGLVPCLCTGARAWRLLGTLAMAALLVVAGVQSVLAVALPSVLIWSLVFALVVLGNGALCVAAWQRARVLARRRRIDQDLAAGWVDRFAGRASSVNDDALRDLAAESNRLELLPRSGLVLRANGRSPRRLTVAYMAEVAPGQPHAYRARLPPGLVREPERERLAVALRRRSLTPAERMEIEAHIRRLRGGVSAVVAVTLVVFAVAGFQLAGGVRWSALTEGVSLAWVGLAIVAWAAYARRVLAARKLEHDRALRWVVTVHDTRSPAPEASAPKLEVLPISQLAWTENAAPAGWRVSRI